MDAIESNILGRMVLVPNIDERDDTEFDPRWARVRILFMKDNELHAFVEYTNMQRKLEEVKVADLTIPKKRYVEHNSYKHGDEDFIE